MSEVCVSDRASQRKDRLRYPCGEAPAPGSALEVAPGVLWQRIPLYNGQTINAWALRDGEGWTVVDTGMSTEAGLAVWQQLLAPEGPLQGRPVTRVIATHLHADHVGMAGWLCSKFDCELWMTQGEYQQANLMHARAAQPMPAQDLAFYERAGWDAQALATVAPMGRYMSPLPACYRRIREGERIRIGEDDWQVLIGNGHSSEHACLYCAPRGLFISGDQVLPLISSNVSVWPLEPAANPMQDWLASLEKVSQAIPDDVLVLPAHDDPFHGLHERLAQLARKRHRALDQLREALQRRELRVVDTFDAVFGRSSFANAFVQQLATGEAVAYLNYLIDRGEACAREDERGIAWYGGAEPHVLQKA
ncbi:MAG: MBL fold metallo-hydrolase [Hydrogenophaga sp.]|uniref:MBL fold metallo-hydrolase n=1 Tax=Hydrogenophaga sp. TaxID=1904254 RepID=UPI0025BA84B5|nr:MBL fold metallo-hydrolase [Hydrogenophaga sp.]MBU7572599.1 MBL fold metallo-hydrolase [Hydrogenophaga sp.]